MLRLGRRTGRPGLRLPRPEALPRRSADGPRRLRRQGDSEADAGRGAGRLPGRAAVERRMDRRGKVARRQERLGLPPPRFGRHHGQIPGQQDRPGTRRAAGRAVGCSAGRPPVRTARPRRPGRATAQGRERNDRAERLPLRRRDARRPRLVQRPGQGRRDIGPRQVQGGRAGGVRVGRLPVDEGLRLGVRPPVLRGDGRRRSVFDAARAGGNVAGGRVARGGRLARRPAGQARHALRRAGPKTDLGKLLLAPRPER